MVCDRFECVGFCIGECVGECVSVYEDLFVDE